MPEEKIITPDQFKNALKLDKIPMPGLSQFLMELMKINKINEVYNECKDKSGVEFVDKVLETVGVKVEINEDELKNIPTEGAFIAVANHPYGGIEGLVLLKILCTARPEAKIMVNFILKMIPTIADNFIAVNPFENIKSVSSLTGMKTTFELLRDGVPIGIFPAGEVSTYKTSTQTITDRLWSPVVGRMIQKAKVPVLPIYFHGNNGLLFNILSYIHPNLRTAKLPSELFNKQGKVMQVRIGRPITTKEIAAIPNPDRLLRFLRARTYAMSSPYAREGGELRKFFSPDIFRVFKRPKEIIPAVSPDLLEAEIEPLRERSLLLTEKDYELFSAPAQNIPNILREIGRLREQTFREVGEGTNKQIDIDEFDLYYNHLFIWDKAARKIVGAYRIGKGKDILYEYGKKGFYIDSLFKMSSKMNPILNQALELGRSFVVKEYQQRALPLFLLWKGILIFLFRNPEYRYLIGPVSISNNFSKLSKALIYNYIRKNCYDEELSKLVTPKKKFEIKNLKIDSEVLLEESKDIKTLDNLIADIEKDHNKIPVLVRQYLALNAKIIAFNVDPKFNDSMDGFLVLDLHQIPPEKIQMLSKNTDLG